MSKPIGWYGADLQEFYTHEQYEEFVKYEVTEGLIPLYTKAQLDAAVKDEREECAKECENWVETVTSFKPSFWDIKLKLVIVGHKAAAKFISAAIIARSYR
jgi:hypothetical protein